MHACADGPVGGGLDSDCEYLNIVANFVSEQQAALRVLAEDDYTYNLVDERPPLAGARIEVTHVVTGTTIVQVQ